MSIQDIGFLLIDNINSKTDINKIKLISSIANYKKELEKQKEKEKEKYNKYYAKYESKRKNNNSKYDKYLKENNQLLQKWQKTKKTKDLYDYLLLNKPDLEEVEDIYTINPILKLK